MIAPLDPRIVALVREGFDQLTRLACANQAGDAAEAREALRDLDIAMEDASERVGIAAKARHSAAARQRSQARLGVIEGGRA